MDAITIRPATQDDVTTIGALWEKLAIHHQTLDPRLPKPAQGGDELYAHRIGSQLGDAYHRILVAEVNGELVGYVLGMIADYMPDIFIAESTGFLADIFVDEAHRGAGIGKKLVSELQAWFKSRGIVTMEWYVAAHNTAAKAFWEHIGGKDLIIRMRLDL
jgi:ribosomal protein S18 acetylase RimI-like enzyme